jgi:hypothetical protein
VAHERNLNHEHKMEVLQHVQQALGNDVNALLAPWLIISHVREAVDWETAVKDCDSSISRHTIEYKSMLHLEAWVDRNNEPHIVIVDEYDPDLRNILRPLLIRLQTGEHRLFMARPQAAPQPSQQINEKLDFMQR